MIRRTIKIGDQYGHLIIIAQTGRRRTLSGKYNTFVVCRCDCGSIKTIMFQNLAQGKTISCGCIQKKRRLIMRYVMNHFSGKDMKELEILSQKLKGVLG